MSRFTVAAVFSDNMVLQRNKNIAVFGEAKDGYLISCELIDVDGKVIGKNETVAAGGKWLLWLEPQVAQTGCRMCVRVKGGNPSETDQITFTNIAIGEIWLAGGQSNMEFELQNCDEAGEAFAMQGDAAPNVRFYYTNKIGWKDEHFFEAEKNTCWQTWESEGKKAWSAVGFFYAAKLARDLDCTVGVVGCNWGGTSASAWMRKEYLEKDDELRTYLAEQEEATRGKTVEQQLKEYDDYEVEMAKWQAGFDKLWAKDHNITWEAACEILGPNPWPGPRSCKNPYRPCGLYDCMLSRIIPYSLRGVIWYQGESDDHKPAMYYKLFSTMIQNWRDDWNDDSLPFIFVQLPNHRYQADRDYKHWCLIREAQEKVHKTIKNAWMTCALDLGMFSDIHPRAKKEVAERMEACAMESVYGGIGSENTNVASANISAPSSATAYSPMLSSALPQGQFMVCTFENAAAGFALRQDPIRLEEYKKMEAAQNTPVPEDYTGFELAGADGVFYPAQFEFGTALAETPSSGKSAKDNPARDNSPKNTPAKDKNCFAPNQIILKSDKVPDPKYARYAWRNYGPVTVYSKTGLPLAPFRTNPNNVNNGGYLVGNGNNGATGTEHAAIQQIMTV